MDIAVRIDESARAAIGAINVFMHILFSAANCACGLAPKRKRPRRIQRKIDKRLGYQHHRPAWRRRLQYKRMIGG